MTDEFSMKLAVANIREHVSGRERDLESVAGEMHDVMLASGAESVGDMVFILHLIASHVLHQAKGGDLLAQTSAAALGEMTWEAVCERQSLEATQN